MDTIRRRIPKKRTQGEGIESLTVDMKKKGFLLVDDV